MSEHDQNRSAGTDTGSSGDAGAPFKRTEDSTAEFLEQCGDIARPMTELGARNMEALVVTCKLAGRTVESFTRQVTEYGRKSFEDAFRMARSFADVRSPADLVRVQIEFARAASENAKAFSSNVTDTLTKMVGEVAGRSEPATSADHPGEDKP